MAAHLPISTVELPRDQDWTPVVILAVAVFYVAMLIASFLMTS